MKSFCRPFILASVIVPAVLLTAPRASAAIVLDGTQNPYDLNPTEQQQEGLLEGVITNNAFDEGSQNNGSGGSQLSPRLGEALDGGTPGPQWGLNTTYIYSGEFFDADGIFTFAENIDDNAVVKIDGVQVLRNQEWNVPTRTNNGAGNDGNDYGMGNNNDGWHGIEIRLSNGGGGAGAVANNNWAPFADGSPEDAAYQNIGFGLNAAGTTSVDRIAGAYEIPAEPAGGGATLFRHFIAAPEDVEVRQDNAVNVSVPGSFLNLNSLSFTTNANRTLTINDSFGKIVRASTTNFNAGVSTIVIGGANDILEFTGSNGGSGGLTKDGPGLLRISGSTTFTGGINIAGGVLEASGSNSLGINAIGLSNGGTLRLAAASAAAVNVSGQVSGVGDVVVTAGNVNFNAPVSVTNFTFTGGTLVAGDVVSTTGNVIAGGGNASFVGGLDIQGALLTNGGVVNVGSGTNNIQSIQPFLGALNIAGNVTNPGGTVIGAAATLVFNPVGTISFNGGVTTDGGKVRAQSGTTNLGTNALTFTPASLREGLIEGFVDATNSADTGTNLGQNGVKDRPRMGETALKEGNAPTTHQYWADNQTWIYSGQFYDADGKFAFGENVDDQTRVKVDGVEVLRNDTWDQPTSTGNPTGNGSAKTDNTNFRMGPNNDGWHDVEFRFNNGGGGAGTVGQVGWGGGDNVTYDNKGFGVNREPGDDLPTVNDGTAYELPFETLDGTPTVFRAFFGGGSIEVATSAQLRVGSTTGASELLYSGTGGTFRLNDAAAATVDNFGRVTTVANSANTLNTGANHTVTTGEITISAGAQLVKSGTGRLVVSGAVNGNTGGVISVTAGSMLFNNQTVLNPDAVTTNVGNGALVGGTGKVPGALNVSLGATVAPGDGLGVLSSGSASFSSGSTFALELASPATSDRLNVTGGLALGNATLSADVLANANFATNDLFFIMLNDGADAVGGTFNGAADNSVLTLDGYSFRISYFANSADGLTGAFTGGNDVALLALVPEPGSLVALVSGASMLVGLQRFRRRLG